MVIAKLTNQSAQEKQYDDAFVIFMFNNLLVFQKNTLLKDLNISLGPPQCIKFLNDEVKYLLEGAERK